jgi:hypothetical protein
VTLGLTGGELFVIGFVVIAVVSAPWWPRLGAAIAARLAGAPPEDSDRASAPPSGRSEGRSDR